MRTESTPKKLRLLNLYAGIGGNRKLWPDTVTINGETYLIEVTAVELNEKIAAIYQDLFPQDTMVIGDAHEFLLNHFQKFDFIWASPPCQSHSRIRFGFGLQANWLRTKAIFPDMKLWQEIIFLSTHAKCDWVVENVIPYYKPLIAPTFQLQRHFFWSNKTVSKADFPPDKIRGGTNAYYQNRLGIDLSQYKGLPNKTQILRNCVAPAVGLHIFNELFNLLTH